MKFLNDEFCGIADVYPDIAFKIDPYAMLIYATDWVFENEEEWASNQDLFAVMEHISKVLDEEGQQ